MKQKCVSVHWMTYNEPLLDHLYENLSLRSCSPFIYRGRQVYCTDARGELNSISLSYASVPPQLRWCSSVWERRHHYRLLCVRAAFENQAEELLAVLSSVLIRNAFQHRLQGDVSIYLGRKTSEYILYSSQLVTDQFQHRSTSFSSEWGQIGRLWAQR